MKTHDRAKAKFMGWPGGADTWPPLAAELGDLIRGTVLFEDPYELVTFLRFMQMKYKVGRVANRFENFDPAQTNAFRNVNTNLIFEHGEERIVVEIQLHLRALYYSAKKIHSAYEVVRCQTVAELVEQEYKWAPIDGSKPTAPKTEPPAEPVVKTQAAASDDKADETELPKKMIQEEPNLGDVQTYDYDPDSRYISL